MDTLRPDTVSETWVVLPSRRGVSPRMMRGIPRILTLRSFRPSQSEAPRARSRAGSLIVIEGFIGVGALQTRGYASVEVQRVKASSHRRARECVLTDVQGCARQEP